MVEPDLGFLIPKLRAIRPLELVLFFTTNFRLDFDFLTLRLRLLTPRFVFPPEAAEDLPLVFLLLTVLLFRRVLGRGVRSRTYTAVLSPATTALMVSSNHVDCIRYLGASCAAVRACVMRCLLTLARTRSLC